MAVIKSPNAETFLKDAVSLDLGDLSRQAARLRAAAEAKAAQIIAAAEAEAARLTETASAKGFDEGHARGLEQGIGEGSTRGRAEALEKSAEQFEQIQQVWGDTVQQLEADRADIHRQARTAVLDLAIHMAEKLVRRIIEVDRTVVIDQVAQALSYVLRPVDVTVRICPDDRRVLEEAMPDLLNSFSHLEHVQLVDDPAISSGGCVVTYGQGRIDATIETQLERVIELMRPQNEQEPES
ncbi:MAG: FliH/SctL family protein [Phycisphaeraceae bacterium]